MNRNPENFAFETMESRQLMSATGEDLLVGGTTTYEARSAHTGGVNVLLADGSVRFLKSTINYNPYVTVDYVK